MIDKNLFPYNLAVMAMMKNEEPYLKEWLDYHLLAGVNHFYIYDNESNDTTKKVLQPYIDADIVTYTPFPGKDNQLLAYNDALQRFKFESRYMAFIDVDEFMFPKAHLSLTKFINDIAKKNPSAGGFEIRFMSSSSNSNAGINYSDILGMINGYATAPKKNIKSIINPRMANYFQSLQSPIYYDGIYATEISSEQIVLKHYKVEPRGEYELKNQRFLEVLRGINIQSISYDDKIQSPAQNNLFDESLLAYREKRQADLLSKDEGIEALFDKNKANYKKVFKSLYQNLDPMFQPKVSKEFLEGKVETFLTCWHLAVILGEKEILNEEEINLLLDVSLDAIRKAFSISFSAFEVQMMFSVLPEILTQPYIITESFRDFIKVLLSAWQQRKQFEMTPETEAQTWKEVNDLNYIYRLVKSFDFYEKKDNLR